MVACCGFIAVSVQVATAADMVDHTTNCQSPGWDMRRELTAFGMEPLREAAADGAPKAPVLRLGTLYALRLHPQGEVRFAEPPGRGGKSTTPMAGMARITVRSSGLYRITLDSPLWIDVVTPEGILAPTDYTGWHECGVFRKSVVFSLKAGHAVALQFSDAATDLVKVVIEPAASP
jgi:hypothetical protein